MNTVSGGLPKNIILLLVMLIQTLSGPVRIVSGEEEKPSPSMVPAAADITNTNLEQRYCDFMFDERPLPATYFKLLNLSVLFGEVNGTEQICRTGEKNRNKQALYCSIMFHLVNGTPQVFWKGCWANLGIGDNECKQDECVAKDMELLPRYPQNVYSCCCEKDYCNRNFRIFNQTSSESPETPYTSIYEFLKRNLVTIIVVTASILCAIIVFFLVFYRLRSHYDRKCEKFGIQTAKKSNFAVRNQIQDSPHSGGQYFDNKLENLLYQAQKLDDGLDLSQLELLQIIGQGRYGSVFRAKLSVEVDKEVAVKIYQPKYREYFVNECNVYSMPHMKHENLLSMIGWKEVEKVRTEGTLQTMTSAHNLKNVSRNSDNESTTFLVEDAPSIIHEYWLVTNWVPRGNLQEFLKGHTLSWTDFCEMGLSLTAGLAYLHSEIDNKDGYKPSIAHRDINSRNVLVDDNHDGRSSLSLIICDLGFAHPLLSSEHLQRGDNHQQNHNNSSTTTGDGTAALNEVGTIRYMAPEILEGAVNLLDPSSALKQIDVYAMGLVFWELISRCHDVHTLLPGGKTPEYSPPFTKEVDSQHISLETMQIWVGRKKVRPALPDALQKLSHHVLRSVRDLVEDLWDEDAEARVSAVCAQHRMQELSNIPFDDVKRSAAAAQNHPTTHRNLMFSVNNNNNNNNSNNNSDNNSDNNNSLKWNDSENRSPIICLNQDHTTGMTIQNSDHTTVCDRSLLSNNNHLVDDNTSNVSMDHQEVMKISGNENLNDENEDLRRDSAGITTPQENGLISSERPASSSLRFLPNTLPSKTNNHASDDSGGPPPLSYSGRIRSSLTSGIPSSSASSSGTNNQIKLINQVRERERKKEEETAADQQQREIMNPEINRLLLVALPHAAAASVQNQDETDKNVCSSSSRYSWRSGGGEANQIKLSDRPPPEHRSIVQAPPNNVMAAGR